MDMETIYWTGVLIMMALYGLFGDTGEAGLLFGFVMSFFWPLVCLVLAGLYVVKKIQDKAEDGSG